MCDPTAQLQLHLHARLWRRPALYLGDHLCVSIAHRFSLSLTLPCQDPPLCIDQWGHGGFVLGLHHHCHRQCLHLPEYRRDGVDVIALIMMSGTLLISVYQVSHCRWSVSLGIRVLPSLVSKVSKLYHR